MAPTLTTRTAKRMGTEIGPSCSQTLLTCEPVKELSKMTGARSFTKAKRTTPVSVPRPLGDAQTQNNRVHFGLKHRSFWLETLP